MKVLSLAMLVAVMTWAIPIPQQTFAEDVCSFCELAANAQHYYYKLVDEWCDAHGLAESHRIRCWYESTGRKVSGKKCVEDYFAYQQVMGDCGYDHTLCSVIRPTYGCSYYDYEREHDDFRMVHLYCHGLGSVNPHSAGHVDSYMEFISTGNQGSCYKFDDEWKYVTECYFCAGY